MRKAVLFCKDGVLLSNHYEDGALIGDGLYGRDSVFGRAKAIQMLEGMDYVVDDQTGELSEESTDNDARRSE